MDDERFVADVDDPADSAASAERRNSSGVVLDRPVVVAVLDFLFQIKKNGVFQLGRKFGCQHWTDGQSAVHLVYANSSTVKASNALEDGRSWPFTTGAGAESKSPLTEGSYTYLPPSS